MIAGRSLTSPINPHSTIPLQPVGSSRILSAAITNGSGKLSRRDTPLARTIPLRMQALRSPSVVRVLSELTRMSYNHTQAILVRLAVALIHHRSA